MKAIVLIFLLVQISFCNCQAQNYDVKFYKKYSRGLYCILTNDSLYYFNMNSHGTFSFGRYYYKDYSYHFKNSLEPTEIVLNRVNDSVFAYQIHDYDILCNKFGLKSIKDVAKVTANKCDGEFNESVLINIRNVSKLIHEPPNDKGFKGYLNDVYLFLKINDKDTLKITEDNSKFYVPEKIDSIAIILKPNNKDYICPIPSSYININCYFDSDKSYSKLSIDIDQKIRDLLYYQIILNNFNIENDTILHLSDKIKLYKTTLDRVTNDSNRLVFGIKYPLNERYRW